jgi:hypothetical protein
MAFADPLALLFSALIGVLVLFYLWERWRRRVIVPSLLLWQAVREDTIRARRFRPDLLFLLQLLALGSLILGLAKPYFPGRDDVAVSARRILVLDTTASMQTREGRSSRFEEARAAALGVLQDLRDTDEVMLISAGHAPEVVVNFTRDHAVVARALSEATATDTGGDLAVALAFAEAAHSPQPAPRRVARRGRRVSGRRERRQHRDSGAASLPGAVPGLPAGARPRARAKLRAPGAARVPHRAIG